MADKSKKIDDYSAQETGIIIALTASPEVQKAAEAIATERERVKLDLLALAYPVEK